MGPRTRSDGQAISTPQSPAMTAAAARATHGFRSKLVDQQCRAIGAGSKQAGLPERFLARVPDKHVHASRAQVVDAHHKGDAQVIVVSDNRR